MSRAASFKMARMLCSDGYTGTEKAVNYVHSVNEMNAINVATPSLDFVSEFR